MGTYVTTLSSSIRRFICVSAATIVLIAPASAQECAQAERNVTRCVQKDFEYGIKRVFAFSEASGTVFHFNNVCAGKVRVVAKFEPDRISELLLEAANKASEKNDDDDDKSNLIAPNEGSITCMGCGKMVRWMACSQRALNPPTVPVVSPSQSPSPIAPTQVEKKETPPGVVERPKVIVAPAEPPKIEPPKPKSAFSTRENWDLVGQDLKAMPNVGVEDCKEACRSDKNCVGITVDRWNKFCFLKSTAVSWRLEPKATSSLREGITSPSTSPNERVIDPYRKRKFNGVIIDTKIVDNVNVCRTACADLNQCLGFSFANASRQCQRFSQIDNYSADDAFESGGKRQN